jgi:RNA-directed DNA polymerase
MNHPNKDGKPSAEGEEGRPVIKENTHQPNTLSTQGEAGVSQGLMRVRKQQGNIRKRSSPPYCIT